MSRKEVKRKLSLLPHKAGVYLFKDKRGKVLYVGKAGELASRVRSHFGPSSHLGLKQALLLRKITDIDCVVTNSELEALLLECNLIKEYRPPYNVRLKDDKKYPFLRLSMKEKFPRLSVTRNSVEDGNRYFGPYSDVAAMRKTVALIRATFPLRTCPGEKPGRIQGRPCLNFHIKRCLAPCVGKIGKDDYRKIVGRVSKFLGGSGEEVISSLEEEMKTASERLDFERAGELRDRIIDIEATLSKQRVAGLAEREMDALGVSKSGKVACGVVLRIRDGKIITKDRKFFEGVREETEQELAGSFIEQYYDRPGPIPQRILCSVEPNDIELLEKCLSGRRGTRVSIHSPSRGKEKGIVLLAKMNADLEVAEKIAAHERKGKRLPDELFELERALGLKSPPRRIEAFDISTVHGEASVGSLVTFIDGVPQRSQYRKFRVRTSTGSDDAGMMFEILSRRMKKLADESLKLPNLLLVDGGKPQVGAAIRAMIGQRIDEIPVFGLAKKNEELYSPDKMEPIRLSRSSAALKLLQRIRDESHRFAVSYHRKVMRKRLSRSALDEIPGIGERKKEALLRKFGSPERVRRATLEELAATRGIGERLARAILEGTGTVPPSVPSQK
ncbi:MAG: excinuclease ABC subunit UvrC [Candidatus Eisenbacteria bacterium]|nr:excinuclease ABC subunit UvrC [Candidatus Eisenbacteria bacterium]